MTEEQVRFKVTMDMSTKPRLGVQAKSDDGRTLLIMSIDEGCIKDWNRNCAPSMVVKPGDRVVSANGVSGDPTKMIQACQNSKKELKLVVEGTRSEQTFDPRPAPPQRGEPPAKKPRAHDPSLKPTGSDRELRNIAPSDHTVANFTAPGAPRDNTLTGVDPTGEYGIRQQIRCNLHRGQGLRLGMEAAPSPDGSGTLQILSIQEPGLVYNWNQMVGLDKQLCVGDKILSINGITGHPTLMIRQSMTKCQCKNNCMFLHLVVEGIRSKKTGGPLLMPTANQHELAMMASTLAQLPAPDYVQEIVKEAELRHQRAENAVRESRQSKESVKKGPGVAALVSGALKRAQEQKKEDSKEGEEDCATAKDEAGGKKEKEANERLAREVERKRANDEAERRRQAVDEARKKAKLEAAAASLYSDMPESDHQQEAAASSKAKVQETQDLGRFPHLPLEDRSKVIFLDVDGVLRPARAGGFEAITKVKADTSDFFKAALEALKFVIVKTGAIIVMSSEWRRDDTLKAAVDGMLTKNGIRPVSDCTTTALELDRSIRDAHKSSCERRAREISDWLQRHDDTVREWVVVDDVNLAVVDEQKKSETKAVGPHLVLTMPLFGFTMGNAKTAIRVLQGEVIQKKVVSNSFPVMATAVDT